MATLDATNQAFYQWLFGFSQFVLTQYGVLLIPTYVQIATPGVNSNNPQEVDAFYLTSPQFPKNGPFYAAQFYQSIFGNDYASLAAIVLTTLSWPSPSPQPLSVARPSAVAVAPPPPDNPIGASYSTHDNGEVRFTDLGSPSIPIGGTWTDPNSGAVYRKDGQRMVIGTATWFVKA